MIHMCVYACSYVCWHLYVWFLVHVSVKARD